MRGSASHFPKPTNPENKQRWFGLAWTSEFRKFQFKPVAVQRMSAGTNRKEQIGGRNA